MSSRRISGQRRPAPPEPGRAWDLDPSAAPRPAGRAWLVFGPRPDPRPDPSGWIAANEAGVHPETGEHVGRWHLPNAVRRCLVGSWSWLVEQDDGSLSVRPYTCGSWRCPFCAWQPAADLCERLGRTMRARDLRELVFVTLTLPRDGSPYAAMARLGRMTRLLWKRVRYDLGVGVGRQRIRAPLAFALVFEAHKDPRWLHGHALVWSRALADRLRAGGSFPSWNEGKGREEQRWRYAVGEGGFALAARAVGFGRVDAQPVESADAIAQYLAKLSRELSGGDRKGQLPILAPARFRRVRSTPGFLQRLDRARTVAAAELVRAPAELASALLASGDEHVAGSLRRLADAAVRFLRRRIPPPAVAEC